MLGDVTWKMTQLSPTSTKLCYDAKLKPNSWGAKLMLAAFEDKYLKENMQAIMEALDSHLQSQSPTKADP
jgi:hypothetical protein